MAEERKEPLVKPKTKEDLKRDKRIKRNCCCCGGVLLLLLIIGIIITVRLFSISADVPVKSTTAPTPTTPAASKSTTNTPAPQSCEQVSTPAAVAMSVSPDNPGFKQDTHTFYYSVYGYNYTQLGDQVRQCGPKVDGTSYGGVTNYNLSWNYETKPEINSCSILNPVVGAKVDIYLPKWQQAKGYSYADSNWQHYIDVLSAHENQHKAMDLAGGQNLYNQFLGVGTKATCQEVADIADNLAQKALTNIANQNRDFDAETNHGANQM